VNQIEIQKRRNDIAKLLKTSNKIHRNCVRINTANGLEHELEKVRQCYLLKQQEMEFYTEANFMYGDGRADILVLDLAQVIEILNGETEEECKRKAKKYPTGLSLVMVDTWIGAMAKKKNLPSEVY